MSTIDQMLKNVRRRPRMMGLDGSFREYVAFLNGLNAGTVQPLLPDFSELITGRSDQGGGTVAWFLLVLREAGFDPWVTCDYRHLSDDEDVRATSTLFELLDEYLKDRPDPFEASHDHSEADSQGKK